MIFLAILGLVLTLLGVVAAAVATVGSLEDDDMPIFTFALIFLVILVTLAIWQPIYWFMGVA